MLTVFMLLVKEQVRNTMFIKTGGYKLRTPEAVHKEMKRKEVINWIAFFVALLLVTICVLEIISRASS